MIAENQATDEARSTALFLTGKATKATILG